MEKQILSDIIVHTKYARYLEKQKRRETWKELCLRNQRMHTSKFPKLKKRIEKIYKDFIFTKKILPSMRSLQFGGPAIELNNSRMFNCAFTQADSISVFSETMFLLLGGTGLGYSIQKAHVEQLPEIIKPNYERERKYVIQDSIMGWADAIKALMKSYTGKTSSHIIFDYNDIREKGALLVTAGGRAPGPEPLRICLTKIESILREKKDRSSLRPIEVHDILCHIADAVLSGGIRRAAMIALFSMSDTEMLAAKSGEWYLDNPQRARANNSVVLLRHKVSKPVFNDLWERIKASSSGEPGIFFTNDKDWGTNPCAEIALRPNQMCNLVEINLSNIENQEDFNQRSIAAAFIGTLQASYTDFHYLRDVWRRTVEKDALLGVSCTGIASESNMKLDYKEASQLVIDTNKSVASEIGINMSARMTAVKPAGTTSLVLGTSSGIHAWHDNYYIRRIRIGKNEAIYSYLLENHKNLIEDEFFQPDKQVVVSVPQKAPEGAITRSESPIDLLERVKFITKNWIEPASLDGQNNHNVSCTVSVKEEQWDLVKEWLWINRDTYTGISVLPYDGGTYKQPPFESITKEEYEKLIGELKEINLTKVREENDNTTFGQEIACTGSSCEI